MSDSNKLLCARLPVLSLSLKKNRTFFSVTFLNFQQETLLLNVFSDITVYVLTKKRLLVKCINADYCNPCSLFMK